MQGGHGDQNNEKHLKIYKIVKLQKYYLETFEKKLKKLNDFDLWQKV